MSAKIGEEDKGSFQITDEYDFLITVMICNTFTQLLHFLLNLISGKDNLYFFQSLNSPTRTFTVRSVIMYSSDTLLSMP